MTAVIAAALVTLLVGCGRYAPMWLPGNPPTASDLVGVWGEGDSVLELSKDGSATGAALPEGYVFGNGVETPSLAPVDVAGSWSIPPGQTWGDLLAVGFVFGGRAINALFDPGGLGPPRLCFQAGDPDDGDVFCLKRIALSAAETAP